MIKKLQSLIVINGVASLPLGAVTACRARRARVPAGSSGVADICRKSLFVRPLAEKREASGVNNTSRRPGQAAILPIFGLSWQHGSAATILSRRAGAAVFADNEILRPTLKYPAR